LSVTWSGLWTKTLDAVTSRLQPTQFGNRHDPHDARPQWTVDQLVEVKRRPSGQRGSHWKLDVEHTRLMPVISPTLRRSDTDVTLVQAPHRPGWPK
jgi:hypothetical protein